MTKTIEAPEQPITRDAELASLIPERDLLASKMDEAHHAARLLRMEFEDAREREDLEAMAVVQPRLAAADTLARQADEKLAPIARRIREIQQAESDERDAAERRARLEELGERVADAGAAYQRARTQLATSLREHLEAAREAYEARGSALSAYQAHRRLFPQYPPQLFDADAVTVESAINSAGINDRAPLQRLMGDPVLGDALWMILHQAVSTGTYEGRRRSGQIRSPLNF